MARYAMHIQAFLLSRSTLLGGWKRSWGGRGWKEQRSPDPLGQVSRVREKLPRLMHNARDCEQSGDYLAGIVEKSALG